MLYSEVSNLIASVGIPYAYRAFPSTSQTPPYLVYFYTGNDDMFADNINYQEIAELRVELYTANKSFSLERQIEAALKNAELSYEKEELYIDDQRIYEIVYQMEVIING